MIPPKSNDEAIALLHSFERQTHREMVQNRQERFEEKVVKKLIAAMCPDSLKAAGLTAGVENLSMEWLQSVLPLPLDLTTCKVWKFDLAKFLKRPEKNTEIFERYQELQTGKVRKMAGVVFEATNSMWPAFVLHDWPGLALPPGSVRMLLYTPDEKIMYLDPLIFFARGLGMVCAM